jgi:precorrin-2 dehydrogenase / sirohydrochlorin ferrochelatase
LIVDLNIDNRNVLVVGAGIEGAKKVKSFVNHNCNITVIGEKVDQDIFDYEKTHGLHLIQKKIENTDFLNGFDNLFLIIATTNDKRLNKQITDWAKNAGILAYSTDDPEKSDIAFMSIITIEGSIQIAISTSGKSPIMTKIIRGKIEDAIKNIIWKSDIDNIKIQEFARKYARKYIEKPQERKEFLYKLINNPELQDLLSKGNIDKVKERIINTLDKLEDNKGR